MIVPIALAIATTVRILTAKRMEPIKSHKRDEKEAEEVCERSEFMTPLIMIKTALGNNGNTAR